MSADGVRVDLKIRGGAAPSKSEKIRGFPDFRGIRVPAVSKTARRKAVLRSVLEGNGKKKLVVNDRLYGFSLWFARLHFITPRHSSPVGFAWLRPRLAKAKKNPAKLPDFLKTGGASTLKTNSSWFTT